jgi:hypothetical protein
VRRIGASQVEGIRRVRFTAGLGGCRQLACIDVLVSLGSKPWCTDSEKDEVLVTYIGNTLAAAGWNEYDISRGDDLWSEITNFHLSRTGKKHVPLGCSDESVPLRSGTRRDTNSSNRGFWICIDVGEFVDEAALVYVELSSGDHDSNAFVHCDAFGGG